MLSLPLVWKGQSNGRLERLVRSTQEGSWGLYSPCGCPQTVGTFTEMPHSFIPETHSKLRKCTIWQTSTEPKLQTIFSYLSLLFDFWQMSMGKTTSFRWESRNLTINEDFGGSYRQNLSLAHFNWCFHRRWGRVEDVPEMNYFRNSNEQSLKQFTPTPTSLSNIHLG